MSLLLVIAFLVFMALIVLVPGKVKGTFALTGVLMLALIGSWPAVRALSGTVYDATWQGGSVFGDIDIRIDSLSAWFILLTNFTMVTGMLFGRQYLKTYNERPAALSLHYAGFLLNHFALTGVYMVHNGLAFLCIWELMTISAFLLVIFEHHSMQTLRAGISFLVQSHLSIVFISLGFIWVHAHSGSFAFDSVSRFTQGLPDGVSLLLFFVFFTGFAFKAGFIPFHTWLPYAHPAAPAHVSAVMSGVMIKAGIYGMFRMLLLIRTNYQVLGYAVLVISVLSGLYGVMLALLQHNLKKLLAYHSIENIGIIGIGMGLGAVGTGLQVPFLAFAGYSGALLHTLNHSLFKSLLFYTSGIVYRATHTMNIEKLGGLVRRMPKTSLLFLLASLAICGLPPFNGFISEFLIYSGLFTAVGMNSPSPVLIILVGTGLVLIGGLAILCFTKAFGIVFLGSSREADLSGVQEAGSATLFPLWLSALFIVSIGLFPQVFIKMLMKPVAMLSGDIAVPETGSLLATMQQISLCAGALILLVTATYLVRRLIVSKSPVRESLTWGCGYVPVSPRLQYTASSYVRSYSRLAQPVADISSGIREIHGILPPPMGTETHVRDRLESRLIDPLIRNLRGFFSRFRFLQNGSVQYYVLYGAVFIAVSIAIPLIVDGIRYLAGLLQQIH